MNTSRTQNHIDSQILVDSILQDSFDAIIIKKTDGTILSWNSAAERMYGYSADEIVGKSISLIVPDEKKQEIDDITERLAHGEQILHFETKQATKGGKIIDVSLNNTPLKEESGSIIAILTIARDITREKVLQRRLSKDNQNLKTQLYRGRKQVQNELFEKEEVHERQELERELEEKTRELAEAQRVARFGSWEWDVARDKLIWSDQLCHLYGIVPGKHPRTFSKFVAEIYPADQDLFQKHIEHTLQTGHPFTFRHRIIRPGGEVRILKTRGFPTEFTDRAKRLRGTSQDITELDHIEEELRQLRLELEYRVIDRTKDIGDINAKLMRSLHEKELLLNEIHHRVKNNLQIISSLIKLQFKQDADPQVAITAIQNRLKAFALVHEKLYGSQDLSQIDFKKYVTDLFKYISRSLLFNGKDIRLQVDIGNAYLDIDTATNLGLILNELIANAIEHGFKETKKGTITVSLKKDDQYILKVTNTGTPRLPINLIMPKSMGLTLVLSLVEQLNGTIDLQTNNNTEFTIMFPAKDKWKTPVY